MHEAPAGSGLVARPVVPFGTFGPASARRISRRHAERRTVDRRGAWHPAGRPRSGCSPPCSCSLWSSFRWAGGNSRRD